MNIKLSFESAMQFVPCQQFLIFGGGGAGGSFKNAVCRNGWLRYSLIVSHLSALLMGSSFPTGKFQLEETRFGWKPILDVPWKGRSKNDPYLWGSLDGGVGIFMIKHYHVWKICYTPQKFDMEPENEPQKRGDSLGFTIIFLLPCSPLGCVYPLAFLGVSFKL